MTLTQYLKTIEQEVLADSATEHTHRPALKALIESLSKGITATNEPQRVECGAPDLIITRGEVPLGYVEAKDVGIPLDKAEKSEQLERYRESLGNLILTDYLEFRWYVRPEREKANEFPIAEHRLTARLASIGKNGKVRIEKEGENQVAELLNAFLNAKVPTVQSAKELAVRMAALARLIRDTIRRALSEEAATGSLHQQMEAFREVLLHDLTEDQFADMYAQTICYGLFAARCNVKGSEHFTREHAAYDLPKTNPFLRKMFNHIAGPELDERIAWAVDDLAEVLHRSDISAILEDFGKSTRREDPVVHFYETFLAAYDPKMREARGVYYTPEPVVSYIVRSIDYILKTDFKLSDGLADSSKITIKSPDGNGKTDVHKVLILDPATGTGTFLYGVINHIFESFKKNRGMWSGYVSDHLLPRLLGFELLMAPYAVAHMKLGLLLDQTGYDFQADERLRVYLTNTLEEAHEVSKLPLFTQWLAEEANEASKVKQEAPVMVVLGNPPYSVTSQNRGDWIAELLSDYKKDLKEKKLNLDDDFIKFYRFAQWRIEQTGYGVLAFISNNTFLDGITHRRMRQSLLETFTDVYILNLHGSSKKKEHTPDGGKDENVFDIQQGVSICFFVKRRAIKTASTIKYADLWGTRKSKYSWLFGHDSLTTKWKSLEPKPGFFFFVPKDFSFNAEYGEYPSVKDIFPLSGAGVKTERDRLSIHLTESEIEKVIADFSSLELSDLKNKYSLDEDSRDWKVSSAIADVLTNQRAAGSFRPILYRPFDTRHTWYSGQTRGFIGTPAFPTMRHLLAGENLALICLRQARRNESGTFFVGRGLIGKDAVSIFDIATVLPLYRYESVHDLFSIANDLPNTSRQPNLSSAFIGRFADGLKIRFIPDGKDDVHSFGPRDVFDYMYAVFYSPTYLSRYAEFLKIEFPRLPLTSNAELFRELCTLGSELVDLHLMERHASTITTYPIVGENEVDKVRYTAPGEGGSDQGRVWINREQYFEGVPPEVWNFHVGGYQVCQKWLKDRKGRKLAYDDLTHYQHIVSALNETIRLMSEIDVAIEAHGGWPLQGESSPV